MIESKHLQTIIIHEHASNKPQPPKKNHLAHPSASSFFQSENKGTWFQHARNMNIAAQSLLQELKAVELFLLLSTQLLQPWFWQMGSEERAAKCVSLPKEVENMQKPNCRHRTYPKNLFFSYNFIFNFKTWGPIILRHCSSHVCQRLVTSIFLSPPPSMSRCLESACSFCIYIRHISYTIYHHAVGRQQKSFHTSIETSAKAGATTPPALSPALH